jgi:hypothetical protein
MQPDNRELATLKSLNLESFRHVRKEHVLALADALAGADPELALQVIKQVPDLVALAKATLDDLAKSYEAALTANAASYDGVQKVLLKRLEILEKQLDRDDLSPEMMLRILDDMAECAAQIMSKDTENKEFVAREHDKDIASKLLVAGTVVALVLGAVLSGRKAGFPRFRS